MDPPVAVARRWLVVGCGQPELPGVRDHFEPGWGLADARHGEELNRPGESGDSGCCLASLGEGGVLTVVDGL
jgi:hypothetical protein